MDNRRRADSAEALARRIDGYFAALEDDPSRRGGPSDLLAAMGMDMETARRLAQVTAGRNKELGRLLREAATRLRAHLETAPAWAGSNASKAVFLIKQQLWDGAAYTDKREAGKPAAAEVRFGGGVEEPFG